VILALKIAMQYDGNYVDVDAVPFGCNVINAMLLQITIRAAWVTGRRWMAVANA
jgi:hypothetical protein